MTENVNTNVQDVVITEKEVKKEWLYYYITAEMGITYERLQAVNWCNALIPILSKLYPDPEEFKAALKRHLVFYNTEAVYGSVINGVTIAMEEQRAKGADISDDAITGMKTGLMGPFAGIGDAIDWATLKPIIFGLGCTLSAGGSPIGAFVLLLLPLIQILVGTNLAAYGYRMGRSSIKKILSSGMINELILGASALGLFMMGALTSSYIKLTTPLQFFLSAEAESPFVVQEILDSICPGLLPLAAVFAIYWWLKKKNQNFAIITILIVVVSLIGAFFGIFG